jgi:signal transduction histidine kinase
VLTFSRLEASRESVRLEAVSLQELVEGTAVLVAPLAAAKGLGWTVALPDDRLILHTDELKVRQILGNLLGNAVKYTERGAVALVVTVDGEIVRFEIRDSGVGIKAEDLDRIFDVFWRSDQSLTRTVDGAGLGLSVSRQLARLLGGDVTPSSTLGQGSTFVLPLPIETTVAAPPEPTS